MKRLIGLVVLVIFSFNCFGQQQPLVNPNDTSVVRLRCCGGSLSNSKVLLIVNNQPYSIKFLNSLSPNIIKDINIFKSGDAVKNMDRRQKKVLLKFPRKKTELISALFILKKSKIDPQYFKFPISFKGQFLDTPYIFIERHKKYKAVLREEVNLGVNSRKITSRYLFITETNVASVL